MEEKVKTRDDFAISEEFILKENPNLKPNVVEGPFESLEEYLSIQQSLLVEDFCRPLRKGLQDVKAGNVETAQGKHCNNSNISKENIYFLNGWRRKVVAFFQFHKLEKC
jgi:hypothetical protein